ncbi:hypothetical protein KKI90_20495 [Xenorhabdus bovienii]|uniref:hypothetical protein n=1 Tax=Xenorhabdus bovienii TaxID=40576 RepID=UPI00237D000B|nr:hypothetical protein [Xenorhabdus bovienii]MDE1487017.1 hypothetical protein [Xenorhabdus bovienii]MDE9479533.1 hypothetical protein [Xenorhabdus bovienii]MDE9532224.1 hypothetical protein [Xenorhabdus bovienii]
MSNKLQAAVEIAEEMETLLVPLMVEIEGGDKTSAYLMCRGIYRQSKVLAKKLREVAGGVIMIVKIKIMNWKILKNCQRNYNHFYTYGWMEV